MLSELFVTLENSALAIELRSSIWLYPLVNTGHIIGVALLAGGSIPINLRRLGVWKSVPMSRLHRIYAGTALLVWLSVLTLGRLIAYF